MPSYLITGASRGLGLGFAAELLKDENNTVIATARNPASSKGLQELKAKYGGSRLHIVQLDVTKVDSIRQAAAETEKLLPNGLDHLVSNAGISLAPTGSFEIMNIDELMEEVNFNVTTPIKVLREFIPLVKKSKEKKILVISTVLGSVQLGGTMPGLANAYSVGKAALNMLIRKWSATLKGEGITTVLLHPGWVGETDLGDGITEWMNTYAPHVPNLSVATSAADCMKMLNKFTPEDNGLLYAHDGSQIPF